MARYKAIKDHLRAAIERGDWEEGAVLPSENQLAAQFGVSRSLARQALRELAIEGFVVRSQGRATRVAVRKPGDAPPAPHTTMQVVALVANGLQTRFTRNVMEHFMHRSAQLGHQTLQYRTWFEPESEAAFLQDLLSRGLSGVGLLLNSRSEAAHEVLEFVQGAGLPFVQIDRALPGLDANVVTSDNIGMGRSLTSRLIQDGHERIAAMPEAPSSPTVVDQVSGSTVTDRVLGSTVTDRVLGSTVADRILGYRQALEAHGIPFDETLVVPCKVSEREWLRPRLEPLLAAKRPPTAFFCVNEFTAQLTSEMLELLGRDPVEEFAFGVIDDNALEVPLRLRGHRAQQNAAALGNRAAELLVAAINDSSAAPRFVRVPPAEYARMPEDGQALSASDES